MDTPHNGPIPIPPSAHRILLTGPHRAPCPRCGSTAIILCHYPDTGLGYYCCGEEDCRHLGPVVALALAAQAWDRQASRSPAGRLARLRRLAQRRARRIRELERELAEALSRPAAAPAIPTQSA